jgi:cell division protease FtsH
MNKNRTLLLWGFFAVVGLLVAVVLLTDRDSRPKTEDFAHFHDKVEMGEVNTVSIKGTELSYELKNGDKFVATGPAEQDYLLRLLDENGVVLAFEEEGSGWFILMNVLPFLLIFGLMFFMMRQMQGAGGKAMSFGKSKAKLLNETGRRVTFEDVAGADEAKEELEEIIHFLKDPRKFTRLGGRIPKGVLLMGPPGTGKTLLARAVAGEAGVPFFSISGSDFVEMFVGVGASRVRDLFEQGKKNAPCIIFIDEIDAVGRHRGAGMGGGHDEREQTLNQLLVEMDGFESNEGVIIMAATNRPDVLDPALLRPGRFDRRVSVDPPDVKGREAILHVHTRRTPLSEDVDLALVARATPGMSGADLENLVNEAALMAARHNKKKLEMEDFEEARDKIWMGPARKSKVVSEEERRTTAYHEAGHAILAVLLPRQRTRSLHKVTIMPRGRAGGITFTLPDETNYMTKDAFRAQIVMAMGGRAAEQLVFKQVNTGAGGDLQQATKTARSMVTRFGMSDKIGPVSLTGGGGEVFLGRDYGRKAEYSEATAQLIDAEVRSMLEEGLSWAQRILVANIHILHRTAQLLLEQETVDGKEFMEMVDSLDPVLPEGIGLSPGLIPS